MVDIIKSDIEEVRVQCSKEVKETESWRKRKKLKREMTKERFGCALSDIKIRTSTIPSDAFLLDVFPKQIFDHSFIRKIKKKTIKLKA